MIFGNEEFLDVFDEMTTAIGQILVAHRQLSEGFLETHVEQAEEAKDRKKAEVQRYTDEIKKTRDAIRRRKELARISSRHESDAKSSGSKENQSEGLVKTPKLTRISDQGGRLVGYRMIDGRQVVFYDSTLRVAAREIGNQTFDRRGACVGNGAQGLRILGQALRRKKDTSKHAKVS